LTGEHDWDGSGRSFQRYDDRRAVPDNQVWSRVHQLGHMSPDTIGVATCKTIVDADVTAIGPTELLESMPKRRDAGL
jgi:hypothetical protein